jgi:hypothetical protein
VLMVCPSVHKPYPPAMTKMKRTKILFERE